MTQETQILNHLKTGGKLTPIDALNNFGCFRLAAVVHSLKKKGHDIHSAKISNPSNGKTYAQYSMVYRYKYDG
jgi:hypothetical protein